MGISTTSIFPPSSAARRTRTGFAGDLHPGLARLRHGREILAWALYPGQALALGRVLRPVGEAREGLPQGAAGLLR